jgi:hypothetical protein
MSVSDSRGRSPATEFLNVDLDIYSRFDLQPLVKALGKKVIILYVEIAGYPTTADSAYAPEQTRLTQGKF